MTPDRLHEMDNVRVIVYDPHSTIIFTLAGKGFHTVEEAIEKAFADSGIKGDIRDYVFRVTNEDTGVSHRYRMNAHEHTKLIV